MPLLKPPRPPEGFSQTTSGSDQQISQTPP
jgi:hypothetical protein